MVNRGLVAWEKNLIGVARGGRRCARLHRCSDKVERVTMDVGSRHFQWLEEQSLRVLCLYMELALPRCCSWH